MLVSSPELTPAEKKVIHEFDALIMKAKKRVNEGLKEVKDARERHGGPGKGHHKDSTRTITCCRVSFWRTRGR